MCRKARFVAKNKSTSEEVLLFLCLQLKIATSQMTVLNPEFVASFEANDNIAHSTFLL